jgi:hypothetical protein
LKHKSCVKAAMDTACGEGTVAARYDRPRGKAFASLPIMKAVGPVKGCDCTGCALSMISTPIIVQPAAPNHQLRYAMVLEDAPSGSELLTTCQQHNVVMPTFNVPQVPAAVLEGVEMCKLHIAVGAMCTKGAVAAGAHQAHLQAPQELSQGWQQLLLNSL